MLLPRTVKVLPNPWKAIDLEGRPCGVCAVEPRLFGRPHIAAEVDTDKSRRLSPDNPLTLQAGKVRTVYRFAAAPVEVNARGERAALLRRYLQRGLLIAADEATAKFAGVAFIDPAKVQADTKARMIAEHNAGNEATFEEIVAQREADEADEARVAAAAKAAAEPQPADPALTKLAAKAAKGA